MSDRQYTHAELDAFAANLEAALAKRGFEIIVPVGGDEPVAKQTYTHRNGETTPPTVDGYYWFVGQVVKPGQVRGKHHREVGKVYAFQAPAPFLISGKRVTVKNCAGQWWGPLLPPWEDAE